MGKKLPFYLHSYNFLTNWYCTPGVWYQVPNSNLYIKTLGILIFSTNGYYIYGQVGMFYCRFCVTRGRV